MTSYLRLMDFKNLINFFSKGLSSISKDQILFGLFLIISVFLDFFWLIIDFFILESYLVF